MKRSLKKNEKVTKGTPSAVLLSVVIHAALFLLAGMLVVFTVTKVNEPEFEAPKAVERPKMKLRKPKLQLKKNAKPKSTTRIVTRNNRANMPDIQLPEMSGMGTGLGEGLGDGFIDMPDLDEISIFGSEESIGNDFVGTFYDMKRDAQGRNIPYATDTFKQVIKQFLVNDWKPYVWAKFYRSPKELYATSFMIPPVPASMAPEAFGVQDCVACLFVVHYKGQLVYPEDIKIRFWGQGDEILAVRVDGKINLLACWPRPHIEGWFDSLWKSSASDSRRYVLGNNYAAIGDWIELKAGVPLDMEIIAGEINGGIFTSMLCVEVEGEEYPKNPYGLGPKLPMFKTAEPSLTTAEEIWNRLDPGDATVTNGPVFRDYKIEAPASTDTVVAAPEQTVSEVDQDDAVRTWTGRDGQTFEAEFMTRMLDYIVVKTPRGKQKKIPYSSLSEADQLYTDLASPPKFSLNFSKKSEQIPQPDDGPFLADQRPVHLSKYTFGVKIKQKTPIKYNHPVTIEYFAIGDEVDGDNYILLARESDTFTPSEENDQSHEFYGKPVRVDRMATRASAPMRGCKYGGYLITVTDPRGKIIQHQASSEFLFEILEDLKKLPITRHFNRNGERVSPPRPNVMDRPDWMRGQ